MIVKGTEVYNLSLRPSLKSTTANPLDRLLILFWAILTFFDKGKILRDNKSTTFLLIKFSEAQESIRVLKVLFLTMTKVAAWESPTGTLVVFTEIQEAE